MNAGATTIAVVDYGMGNLRSVEKALERAGAEAEVTRDHGRILAADGLVLPGVGAFPKAMGNLRQLGLEALLKDRAAGGAPVLGICLGMQLLFESSSEGEGSGGGAAFEAEFAEDIGHVSHGRAVADEECFADFSVGQPVHEQAEHVRLAAGQSSVSGG